MRSISFMPSAGLAGDVLRRVPLPWIRKRGSLMYVRMTQTAPFWLSDIMRSFYLHQGHKFAVRVFRTLRYC